jgi:hydroxyquinol 1,2-dioxygenase
VTTVEEREQAVTDEVVASFAGTKDDRLREVLESLTRHLHAFARDVRLTEQEWEAGIGFLTRVGHITDDRRQEFILLSDVLGLSMQVVGINSPTDPRATESTVFGPFFVDDAPEIPLGGDIANGATGHAVLGHRHGHRHRRHPDRRCPDRRLGGRRRRPLRRPWLDRT